MYALPSFCLCVVISEYAYQNSGDATLAVFDLRRNKLEGRITNQEDELLSIQILKVCIEEEGGAGKSSFGPLFSVGKDAYTNWFCFCFC